MQLKLATLTTLIIASFAAATPLDARTGDGGSPPPASQCNTGPVQCCNSVQAANSPAATTILGLLGVVLQDLTVLVGLDCSPVSAIGIGGNSCTAQPVCCENNTYSGVIVIGCSPVNINL